MNMSHALELPACNDKVLCLGEEGACIFACMQSDIAMSDTGNTYCTEEEPSSSRLVSGLNPGSN
jgi:hypothetical protein